MWVLIVLMTVASTVTFAQNPNDLWPKQFTSFWRQFITMDDADAPPYVTLGRPKNARIYYGTTWYDYTGATKKQFQTFPGNAFAGLGCPYSDVTCQMLNLNDTVWTWTLDGPNALVDCCIEQRVWVLPPGFVHEPGVSFKGYVNIAGENASYYGVPRSDGVGPFGYHFYQDRQTKAGTQFPAAHWGHNLFNLTGWRWQTYLYYDVSPPDQEVFELPKYCRGAPPCKNQTPPPIKV